MYLLPTGEVALAPPEAMLVARALENWSHQLEGEDSAEMVLLYVDTLALAFLLLGRAQALEFHVTPAEKERAKDWVNTIVEEMEDEER